MDDRDIKIIKERCEKVSYHLLEARSVNRMKFRTLTALDLRSLPVFFKEGSL